MTTQELYIGQPVYLVSEAGRVSEFKIVALSTSEVSISFLDYNKYPQRYNVNASTFKFNINGYYETSMFHICYTQQHAADIKKENVIKSLDKEIALVEKHYANVKKIREEYYDVLNSSNIDNWIDEFKRNNNW